MIKKSIFFRSSIKKLSDISSCVSFRIRNAHSEHHSIARGMFLVALFVLLGSLVRAGKEMAIAYRYGVSSDVDAYIFVFNLVCWPAGIWLSGLNVVLIPLLAQIRQNNIKELTLFQAELLGLTIVFGIALLFSSWVGLPLLLQTTWVGLPSSSINVAKHIASELALLAPLGIIISFLSTWMLSEGRHANTMFESLPSFIILISLLTFPNEGLNTLIWGTILGFVAHLISLLFSISIKNKITIPNFSYQSSHWAPFWKGFGLMLGGQTLMSLTGLIDQFFASHLGAGAIAILSYANRILALILGVCSVAVSRATLPVFSQALAQGRREIDIVASHWMRIMFILGLVAMVTSWILAPVGVRLLYERGAFSTQNTEDVVEILRFGLLQLPFYFSGLVIVTYLSSRELFRLLFWSSVSGLCLKIVANLILVPIFGVKGLSLSTGIMYVGNFVFLFWMFKKVSPVLLKTRLIQL